MRRPRKPDADAAEADERTVRTAALALLAGRDFGRTELARRLARRGYPAGVVAAVVDGLVAERLLSDTRYVEQFIRQHAGRGHGPVRIRADLRERGVPDDEVEAGLAGRRRGLGRRWRARRAGAASGCRRPATTRNVQDRRASSNIAGLPPSRSGPHSARAKTSNHEHPTRTAQADEQCGTPHGVPRFLPGPRPRRRALELARAGQRPDAAVHQRRHGAVQGRVPRQGPPQLQPRRELAALRARRRQAQRPRERGLHGAPPHVLRDARQLQLRRLLQARGDPLRLGLRHRHARHPGRAPVGHGLRRGRRRRRDLAQGDRRRSGALHAARREVELLGDGRHRPLRPVHRDLLRPRPRHRGRPAGLARRGRRPLRRDLEPRVHAVRPRGRRHADAAAEAVGRHRHGPRAHRGRDAGRAQQLRHRPVPRPDRGRGAEHTGTTDLDGQLAARHRRPHPRERVPDRRRRAALERGPRLRAAPDHPPRHPPRLHARPARAVLPQARRHARAGDGRGLSRARLRSARTSSACSSRRNSASPRRSRRAWRCSTARSASSKAGRSPARRSSASTTPTASRSTSPTTSRASAASPSTRRASRRRWTSSARGRAPRASSASTCAPACKIEGQTAFTGYDARAGRRGASWR